MFRFTDTDDLHDDRGREGTLSMRQQTFRHWFATFRLKLLPHIFRSIASNYSMSFTTLMHLLIKVVGKEFVFDTSFK